MDAPNDRSLLVFIMWYTKSYVDGKVSSVKLPATKSVTSRRTKTLCGVCRSQIVEGKEEALLCEGDCGQWLHRGCASVPQERYKELANSNEPFVYLHFLMYI